MPVVLIDNYDSFTFNLYQMVQVLTEETVEVYRNGKIDFAGLRSLQRRHSAPGGAGLPGARRLPRTSGYRAPSGRNGDRRSSDSSRQEQPN